MPAHLTIIGTGGTFGMLPSPAGLVPASLCGRIEELARAAVDDEASPIRPRPTVTLVEIDPPIDSAEATPSTWQAIVDAVRGAHPGPVIVIHGTDTMAYSAAAVAFAVPERRVVVTGSQSPLAIDGSDARANLHEAVALAVASDDPGAWIAFAARVIRATRATKDSTEIGEGFREARGPLEVRAASSPVPGELVTPPSADTLHLVERLASARYSAREIPVLRLYPGITAGTIAAVLARAEGAAVLELYGSGNAPVGAPGVLAAIESALGSGTVVVGVSQCLDGGVRLGTYGASSPLAAAGIVDGGALTTEAALTKLHLLLAAGLEGEALRASVGVPLSGEFGD